MLLIVPLLPPTRLKTLVFVNIKLYQFFSHISSHYISNLRTFKMTKSTPFRLAQDLRVFWRLLQIHLPKCICENELASHFWHSTGLNILLHVFKTQIDWTSWNCCSSVLMLVEELGLWQMEPFIKSTVIPVRDDYPADKEPLSATIQRLLRTLADVQQLQIKIKVCKDWAHDKEYWILLPTFCWDCFIKVFGQILPVF